jgi:Class II flagellar assembly regulator
MRVDSRSPAPSPASAAPPRGAAAARFSLGQVPAAGTAGKAAAAAPLATLDALLAVQGEGDPAERRRSLRRGQDLLESLDRLKAALLAGRLGAGQLQALAGQLGRAGSSGDPGLDDVVAQIELRAQVELAKLRRA